MVHRERYSSSYPRHTDLRVFLRPRSDFLNEHPQYVAQSNAMNFLSDDSGAEYNLCHCTSLFRSSPRSKERALNYDVANQLVWSNLRLRIWTLGVAMPTLPTSSISTAMVASTTRYNYSLPPPPSCFPKNQIRKLKILFGQTALGRCARSFDSRGAVAGTDGIHFFRDIGYEHSPYAHCPAEKDLWESGRCTCDPAHSFGM